MPRLKLTTATLERTTKLPKVGQVDYFDTAFPALALRVTCKGARSWTYFGRVNGKLRRVTLGRWPQVGLKEARTRAGEVADSMRAGTDPTAEKRTKKQARAAGEGTVAQAVAEWLKRDQAKNRRVAETARFFEREVLPAWGERQLADIRKRDVIALVEGIADRAPIMANRALAGVRRFFNWAAGRDLVDANPAAFVEKPSAERSRDRVLTDEELRAVWLAAEPLGWPFGAAVRLLVLTGARREEIGDLRWSEVDLDAAALRLAGERSKTGEPRLIPLSVPAVALLETLPRIDRSPFVFTTTGRSPISGWSRTKARLDRASGVSAWRLHDLRRTVATGLQKLGTRLEVTEAVLGHVAGSRAGIVGVYQRHRYEAESRAALEAWADHVARVVGAEPAKVVALRA